jgi:myo-inositol-1(or 4)-monophosphatase
MNNANYLKVAIKAAKDSGVTFKKYFGKPGKIVKKGGNKFNLVTPADLAIEKLITKSITKNFPYHQILGEEAGWNKKKENNYKWIIDPIDGTTNFIQGIPLCATSIALWDYKGPLIAVVYDPLHKKLYQAVRGYGAKMNGKTIKVSKVGKMADAIGGFGWNEAYNPSLLDATGLSSKIISSSRKSRALATTTLQMAYVAEGIFDFFVVNAIKVWDFAASQLLITEAGGKVTDWKNNIADIKTTNIIATNGKIHSEIITRLKA